VTGVQTCALPISRTHGRWPHRGDQPARPRRHPREHLRARGQWQGRDPLIGRPSGNAKGNGPRSGPFRCCKPAGLVSGGLHRVGLQALLALDDGEGDLLAFLQALEALHLDGTEVDEHVLAILAADEAEALGIIEPFDGPGLALCHYCYSWNFAGWVTPLPRWLVARSTRGVTM